MLLRITLALYYTLLLPLLLLNSSWDIILFTHIFFVLSNSSIDTWKSSWIVNFFSHSSFQLVFLLGIKLWMNRKTSPIACGFVWFWYTWCWAKLLNFGHRFIVWSIYHHTALEVLLQIGNGPYIQTFVCVACWLFCL